jgi:Protein of unknown function (DUF3606)
MDTALLSRKPPFRTTSLRTLTLDSRTVIRMDGEYEVRAWCNELGCSYQQLLRAIAAVGPSVERVCGYLAEQ